jgi:hypothetical protein
MYCSEFELSLDEQMSVRILYFGLCSVQVETLRGADPPTKHL